MLAFPPPYPTQFKLIAEKGLKSPSMTLKAQSFRSTELQGACATEKSHFTQNKRYGLTQVKSLSSAIIDKQGWKK